MPSHETFLIPPIAEVVGRYVGDGKGWVDPFAGDNSPAEITNDLNPAKKTSSHLHALDFVTSLDGTEWDGVLFDPPYSLRQVKEMYDGIGYDMTADESQLSFAPVKSILARKVRLGGTVICCGWNSNGFGLKRGFEMVEILLVPHGRSHNDTIVTVEYKYQATLL